MNQPPPASKSAATNPLVQLSGFGQSPWLDYIRRDMLFGGELARLVANDGLGGVTSNPAIFEKAIAGSTDYNNSLAALVRQKDREAKELYELVAIRDVQDAADVLYPVYMKSNRRDGYVSLEVSPYLAHDTAGTLDEARRLWRAVGRDNVMIKVPATPDGIPAIQQLIGEGININVTLLFAQDYYERVAEAYVKGLEQLDRAGGDVKRVASVASFFVSRIDSNIDGQLELLLKSEKDAGRRTLLEGLRGKVAIANAKLAYQSFQKLVTSARWKNLGAKGAMPQRMLWASTSTKNPSYRDVIYVEELIGEHTVNTMPPATFDGYRDHGRGRASLIEDLEGARKVMADLERAGISMKKVTDQLLVEAVKLFAEAFDRLLGAVERKRQQLLAPTFARTTCKLPADLDKLVATTLNDWRARGNVRRLWAKDATLWTGMDEGEWLGWLNVVAQQEAHLDELVALQREIKREGHKHLLLLGMGGSSLCPEVFKLSFGAVAGFPELEVLDSTDPAQIRAFEKKLDYKKTMFIVSSKSGSTLEPNIFKQYFFERARAELGADEAPNRFIAITDPGSQLEAAARRDRFRHIYHGVPSIGGRYSALSNFGMVPFAAMGLDLARFLERTKQMVHACSAFVPPEENPGVLLGAILGTAATHGRDKLTIIASPGVHDLGAWLEQLLAESTGKEGKGIIPVDREALGSPDQYGKDRVFAYLRLAQGANAEQDRRVEALEQAGHPVVRIEMADGYSLGQEFFRWEIATAVAGSIIGIHTFNQPDVEASKIETRKLTNEYEKSGAFPAEKPLFTGAGVKLFADARNAADLARKGHPQDGLHDWLAAHLDRLGPGDYFALLAYVAMTPEHEALLQELRTLVRNTRKVATCLGFGPRFLHSTGQAYKGGPASGVFLQITADDAADLPVPGAKYTFGVVKVAQAAGDLRVIEERGRRALRVHLGKDTVAGLRSLVEAARKATAQARSVESVA